HQLRHPLLPRLLDLLEVIERRLVRAAGHGPGLSASDPGFEGGDLLLQRRIVCQGIYGVMAATVAIRTDARHAIYFVGPVVRESMDMMHFEEMRAGRVFERSRLP